MQALWKIMQQFVLSTSHPYSLALWDNNIKATTPLCCTYVDLIPRYINFFYIPPPYREGLTSHTQLVSLPY